jgi:hypothetical protein
MIRFPEPSLILEFLVATANLIHPSEQRSSTLCISILRILKAGHNVTFKFNVIFPEEGDREKDLNNFSGFDCSQHS